MKKIIVTESQLKRVLNKVIEEQSSVQGAQTLERAKANSQFKTHPYPAGVKNLVLLTCSPSIKINGKPCKKGMPVLFTDAITGNDGDSIMFVDVKGWGQTQVQFQGGKLVYTVFYD